RWPSGQPRQDAARERSRGSCEPPAQEVDEQGRAHYGGNSADGEFIRRNNGTRQRVREHDGNGTANRGCRQQGTIVRAEDEEHDDGGDERSSDDTAEKERSAVNLAFAPAEKIDDSDSSGGPEKGAERSQQCGEHWRKRDAGFDDERKDCAEACTARNAEDVGISERIT